MTQAGRSIAASFSKSIRAGDKIFATLKKHCTRSAIR
jgi:hypothetical protein